MAVIGEFGDPCIERHNIVITDRGGENRLFQPVSLNSVVWGRNVDAKTNATVILTGRACIAQTALLKSIEPRRHEMVIYRGDQRVWEGPIVRTKSTASRFEINANDVIEYLDYTPLSKPWPGPPGGGPTLMTQRLQQIIEYELSTTYHVDTGAGLVPVLRWEQRDPPANVLPYFEVRAGTTRTLSSTEAFEMSLGEHLYNLGRSIGVHYTTVGRKLLIWEGLLGQLRTVTENDFAGDFEVISDGGDFHNVAHVVTTNNEEGLPPAVGHAGNDQSYYGPWEKIFSVEDENGDSDNPDQVELNSQARRTLAHKYPVPLVLNAANGAGIIPSKGITINQLVAGVQIPVNAAKNIRAVTQMQRLESMTVTESASEGETISVTLGAQGQVMA